jgi:transposase
MDYLKDEINDLERVILNTSSLRARYDLLTTVPGIGKTLAMTISLETGNIGRFEDVGNYASYCRCVPAKRFSNDKCKGNNNSKNGNKYLAWAFLEAANFMKRHSPAASAFCTRKTFQANKIVALKALAHKIARACYHIMKNNIPFEETKMFGTPIILNKGCSSKPSQGLLKKQNAPIGSSAATTFQSE